MSIARIPFRLLLLSLFLSPGALAAGNRDGADGIVRIDRLRDPGRLSASASGNELEWAEFVTAPEGNLLRARSGAEEWWRIVPAPSSIDPGGRLLAVFNSYTARVTVLSPPDYAPRSLRIFDAGLDPRYSRRALVFPLASSGSDPIYLHVAGARGDPPWVVVADASAYTAEDHRYTRMMYTLQAMLGTVALVVLLFWMRLRERVYLLFSVYIALLLYYLMISNGEAYALPTLRSLAGYGAPGIWLLTTVTLTVSVFFVNEFADLARLVPRLSRVLLILASVLFLQALFLILPWPSSKEWYPFVANILVVPVQLIALVALVIAARRGGRHAGSVLLAWAPLVFLTIARAIQVQSGMASVSWLEFGLPLAFAFGAIVLTYGLAVRMLSFRHERDLAIRRAELDPLTGAMNRGAGLRRLDRMASRIRTQKGELSILFLDLDHFKAINDQYGHLHGDACLRAVVGAVGHELRQRDVLVRFGGEEFVVALPGAASEDAAMVAERIRRGVEANCGKVAGHSHALTVSVGVASYDRDRDRVRDLLERGDAALYRGKSEGRNRVVVALRRGSGPIEFVPGPAAPAAATAEEPSEV